MKKAFALAVYIVVLFLVLISCGSGGPTVEINADGYVVVNGVATDILADKADEHYYSR